MYAVRTADMLMDFSIRIDKDWLKFIDWSCNVGQLISPIIYFQGVLGGSHGLRPRASPYRTRRWSWSLLALSANFCARLAGSQCQSARRRRGSWSSPRPPRRTRRGNLPQLQHIPFGTPGVHRRLHHRASRAGQACATVHLYQCVHSRRRSRDNS